MVFFRSMAILAAEFGVEVELGCVEHFDRWVGHASAQFANLGAVGPVGLSALSWPVFLVCRVLMLRFY